MKPLHTLTALFLLACSDADVGPELEDTRPPKADSGTASQDASRNEPPSAACRRGMVGGDPGMLPGPDEAGFDAALQKKAARYDRLHDAVGTYATDLAATLEVDPAQRDALDKLLNSSVAEGDVDPSDDLQQYAGIKPDALVKTWGKSTGLYAGVEIAADAFRYAVLRDRGGSCLEADRAKHTLVRGLKRLHDVRAIAGGPYGFSIARSIARKDLPGDGKQQTFPLVANGKAFPAEKNNGTWREDNSSDRAFGNLVWEDSCSRDMLFGWTMAMASAWEVVKDDPTIDAQLKQNLQADARSILAGLMVKHRTSVGTEVDLELWDPDGRRTYHGNLHETSVDRNYIPFVKNGPASMMALGEIAGLAYVADSAPALAYLNSLIDSRGLAREAAGGTMSIISLAGERTNHSSYNMLFVTGWMAGRYINHAEAKQDVAKSVQAKIYAQGPSTWGQSFYDLVFAASTGNASVSQTATAVEASGLGKLRAGVVGFRDAPFWGTKVENCDAAEIASGSCTLNDGTVVSVTTSQGSVVADRAVPIGTRPPSNFYWRSNPFEVNGDWGANTLFPGSDFRVVYWLGRYLRMKG